VTFIIALSNEKGGVAKTTTCLSLGAALSESGKRVLLVDLDPQANLTLAFGLEPSRIERSASAIFIQDEPLLSALHKTNFLGLDLIPSNLGLEQAEQILPSRNPDYAALLRESFQQAELAGYDLLLMDCPPSLGVITINALTAADLLIIPTQAEYFSAYALRDMMGIVRQVRSENNPELAYRILITLLDNRNRTHRNIHEQLERAFGDGLFRTIIEIDTKLRESPILGLPITQYKPNSRGALQYRQLAEELLDYVQKTN